METDGNIKVTRVSADFNGVFKDGEGGEILCLSHGETSKDENGNIVPLRAGMVLTAFMEDGEDEHGNRDDLIASGVVEPSPPWLRCYGSKWALRIDENGVRHESDLRTADQSSDDEPAA